MGGNANISKYMYWGIQIFRNICIGEYKYFEIFVLGNTNILKYLYCEGQYKYFEIYVLGEYKYIEIFVLGEYKK